MKENPLLKEISSMALEPDGGATVYWKDNGMTKVSSEGECLAFWPSDRQYHPVDELHTNACRTFVRRLTRKKC